jgi:DNA-binding CsgD family transcriptional regulator
LHDARRSLGRGRGSLAIVEGEAGIGKSRLVTHFSRDGGATARVLTIECVQDAGAELQPLRAALAGLWDPSAGEAPPIVMRTIVQLLPDAIAPAVRASYAGATLGRAELFAGIAAALGHITAKRGTILILEDLHWADDSTLHFLAGLAPQLESMRLMLVATIRSEPFERRDVLADVTSRLLRAHTVRHITLRPLPRDDVADLIDGALTGRRALPPAVVADIIRRSDGNPFFAEELLKVAVDRDPSERDVLPVSIRASVRHRLAHFDPADRALLDVAAVLGLRFDHALLAELTGRSHDAVLRVLRDARAANIVDDVDPATCRFHHALTRQTIYDALLAAETQALHRRILAALEHRPDAGEHVATLAYHAWEAHDAAALLRYGEQAGDHAAEHGLFADARACYERMLTVVESDEDRARLEERIGNVSRSAGDFGAAIAAFQSAFDLRLRRGEGDDAARLAVALAVERSNSGGDALTALESFLTEHGPGLGRAARDGAAVFLARMYTALGRFDDAEARLRDTSPPDALEPRVRANLLTCRLNLSEHRNAIGAWRDAARAMLTLAPELPPLLRSIQLTTVAQTGAWFGERDIAETALREAQAIATHWGFEGILTFSRAVEAQQAFLAGDLAAAQRALDAVARRPDVVPAWTLASRIAPFLGAALADVALTTRWLAADAADGEDAMYADAATLAASALETPFPRGDVVAARARLTAYLQALPPEALVPATVMVAAAQHVDAAQLPVLRTIAQAMRSTHASGMGRAGAELALAIVAARSAEPDRALAASAADGFRALRWPLFEALALEAAGHPAEAYAIFHRCGARDGMQRLCDHEPAEPAAAAAARTLLTAREWEVAVLVAEGKTNLSISERLDVGIKTVEKHVSSVLLKLNARSRAQIATFVATTRNS